MSVQIKRRGDTTAAHRTFIGANREITIDTDKRTIVVHDGETAGGFPLAREDLSNLPPEVWESVRRFVEDKLIGTIAAAPLDSLSGFLLCNGAAISRTSYAKLFAKIGATFGAGDGATTFNLPDYRGTFLRGLGDNSAAIGTRQQDAAPNITGGFNTGRWGNNSFNYNGAFTMRAYNGNGADYSSSYTSPWVEIDASRASAAYGRNGATEVRPTNHAVNFFIKY